MKKRYRTRLVLEQKRFAETRSHWSNPMFPGDWGCAPTSKPAQIGVCQSEPVVQSAAALALLATMCLTVNSKSRLVLFNSSYLSYNERVIGLSVHC